MPKKEELLKKLLRKPIPKNFTKSELDMLMKKYGCIKYSSKRGSGIAYFHKDTNRILQFDEPHPGKELHIYQIKMTIQFLKEIGVL